MYPDNYRESFLEQRLQSMTVQNGDSIMPSKLDFKIPIEFDFSEAAQSLTDRAGSVLGAQPARTAEDVIKCVLDETLGEGEWTIQSLKGRISGATFSGSPATTYCLDGKPILELYPPEIKTVHDEKGLRMVATTKWRRITSQNDKDRNDYDS
jgi:hypothetical protein